MSVTRSRRGRVELVQLECDGELVTSDALGLQRVCAEVAATPDVLAVVFTGTGCVFCTGELPPEPIGEGEFLAEPYTPGASAVRALASLPVPVVVAVNGAAAGLGVELALGADIRLASQHATFQMTQAAGGILPYAGGTQRLPRVVGRAAALELLLLGETINAQDAWRMGLVSKVLPPEQLEQEALSLAQRITEKAPIQVRYLREAVQKGLDLTLDQGLRLEADLYFLIQTTADRMEGIRSFLEKRPPNFRGE